MRDSTRCFSQCRSRGGKPSCSTPDGCIECIRRRRRYGSTTTWIEGSRSSSRCTNGASPAIEQLAMNSPKSLCCDVKGLRHQLRDGQSHGRGVRIAQGKDCPSSSRMRLASSTGALTRSRDGYPKPGGQTGRLSVAPRRNLGATSPVRSPLIPFSSPVTAKLTETSLRQLGAVQAPGGGFAALFEQDAGMVGMLDVEVALVAAQVPGEEAFVVVDPQPLVPRPDASRTRRVSREGRPWRRRSHWW